MGIKYSGAARTGTFDGSTRLSIVDGLKAALESAGWTTVSGSSGDWKLNSGITPSGHQIRVRLYDPGSGQSARARLMSVNETIAPDRDMLLYAVSGRVYRWFASPYQFFVLAPGTIATGSDLACGIPWLPSFLNPANVGWMGCSAQWDGDTENRDSFRAGGDHIRYAWGAPQAAIYGNSGWWSTGGSGEIAVLGMRYAGDWWRLRYWADGSSQVYEPLIGWGPTRSDEASRLIGQLWDAIVVEGDWPLDTVLNFDGKQWWCYYKRRSGQYVTLALLYPTT